MPGIKLLVADDSLTIQKVIRLALSRDEYEIQAVSDGNDATQHISLIKPKVVLVDISLPGKTAFEVKAWVNEHPEFKAIRFVLLSSAFEKMDEAKVEEVQFHGRLIKPFDPAQLREVLTRVLADAPTLEIEIPEINETSVFQKNRQDGGLHPPTQEEPDMTFESKTAEITQEVAVQLDTLWDKEDPFPALAPPPLPKNVSMEETDVGENPEEFQWSIRENPARTPAPFTAPSEVLAAMRDHEPSLAPPPLLLDLEDVSFEMDSPIRGKSVEEIPSFASVAPPPPPLERGPDVLPMTTAQMEELLKKQLEESLEKMIQKILPEIAERVIKQEIHRMLEEKP